jgi:ABC-type sugar transport system ATPase subunit
MDALLKMTAINKSFASVHVLQDVHFNLAAGEVHALLGENGAGKSTLIKILGGVYTKDSGEITIDGREARISDVASAQRHGISIIHQELMLAPDISIAENIFVGRELTTKLGLVDMPRMEREAQEMLDAFGLELRATVKIGKLTIAQRQMIEIVRAISFGAKIIVMDEPTSSLSENEVEILFDAIRRLRDSGVGIIYISHR